MNVIGADVGGTKIAAGVVRFPEGTLLAKQVIPTRTDRSGEEILADLESLIRSFSNFEPAAIGIGLCEIVDHHGEIQSECAIRWRNVPVLQSLSQIAPSHIEADVRAAALAESLFGAGRNTRSFLYVTIGTGISNCLVIDGLPYTGALGAAGTMASGPLPQVKPALSLEQIASGPGMVDQYNAAGHAATSAQQVFAAAAQGDYHAREVIETAAHLVGATLGWMVNILDPERIVLGGGIGVLENQFRDHLLHSLRAHTWWPAHRTIPVHTARLGPDAGLIGAAASAWKRFSAPP